VKRCAPTSRPKPEAEHGLRHVGSQRLHPLRSEDLEQRVEALHRDGAAINETRPDLDGALQRIARPDGRLGMQSVGVEHRQACQELGIEPVVLACLA
jgi:hypothetical protein